MILQIRSSKSNPKEPVGGNRAGSFLFTLLVLPLKTNSVRLTVFLVLRI